VLYDFKNGGPARPYLKGGAGVYWMKSWFLPPSGAPIAGDRVPMFGYNVEAGVAYSYRSLCDVAMGGTYHAIPANGHVLDGRSSTNFFTVGVRLVWGLGDK
jgi:hypothetical protein